MPADPPDPFLAALRDSGLLLSAQLDELADWMTATRPDPNGLAKEVHRRGWLTPFQLREIFKGRGNDLQLGPYLLLELLGEGGMGRVFKARHTRLGREVALKVIRKEKLDRPNTVQRFRQEVRAVAQLAHPNVVLALDADEANGTHFYAMEYVEGTDLTKMVEKHGPPPPPLACEYVRQAALGLEHAHERGLVHRDVKPSNLLVTPKGQVKLLDLGLAMLRESAAFAPGAARVTQEGLVLGTPDFLAPEQAQNPGGVDIRADVYSLGATLYYLLTGRPPYPGNNPTDKIIKHVTEPPPSVLAVRPDLPPQLDGLVKWMMAKKPDDRPPTPAHVAFALAPFCPPPAAGGSGLMPMPPGFVYQPPAPPAPGPVPGYAPAPPPGYGHPPLPGYGHPPAYGHPHPPADPFADTAHEPAPPAAARARKPYKKAGSGVALKLLLGCGVLTLGCGGAGGLLFTLRHQFLPDTTPLAPAFENVARMRMVLVQPGSFVMGSPADEVGRKDDEGPTAEVTLTRPFYLSQTEVTRAQFVQVLGLSHSQAPVATRNGPITPEDSVTWDEAVSFCRKLNEKDGRRKRGWAYRLPTEAEWEYAARAGKDTPFGFGKRVIQLKQAVCRLADADDPYADIDPERPDREREKVFVPYPAGQAEANPFGLSDLHGNLWEWCGDYYDAYAPGPRTDPTGPPTGDWRVLRGGSYADTAAGCRAAARKGADPQTRDKTIGFRVVFAQVD